jgi:hypothetical protein
VPLPKPTNPENEQRTFVVDDDWWLHDPTTSLSWEVFKRTNEQKIDSASAKTAADLVADRLSVGHFKADIGGLGLAPALYFVRWYVVTDDLESGVEVVWDGPDFEVFGNGSDQLPGPNYALVRDLRREGLPSSVDDARALRALHVASRYVERFTARRFVPEAKTLRLDAFGGNHAIRLDQPIVALSRVAIDNVGHEPNDQEIDRNLLRVYHRHLSQAMLEPDDREDPRVELQFDADGLRPHVPMDASRGLRWPLGRQDIVVAGVFGYTEPNGSPMGITPELIRHATILFALRETALLGDRGGRAATRSSSLKREKTRDQEVEYAVGSGGSIGSPLIGAYTGDPEIDSILAMFRRPGRLGAA